MFGKIKEYFKGQQSELHVDGSGNATENDLIVAVAVLLFEMAGADSSIAHEEASVICDTIQSQFKVPEEQIPELIEIAVAARQAEGKIDEFVKLINENFNVKQRQRVLAMIWKVVRADGNTDKFEQRLATQFRYRLKLTEEQADEAKSMEL